MIQGAANVRIARAVADVFALVAEGFFENQRRWETDLAELERTSDGPLDVGASGRQVHLAMGQRVESRFEIVDWLPGHCFGMRGSGAPTDFRTSYGFEASEDGTLVTFVYEMQPLGMYRFMESMIAGMAKRGAEQMLAQMKQELEAEMGG